jgi:hypothetical protein
MPLFLMSITIRCHYFIFYSLFSLTRQNSIVSMLAIVAPQLFKPIKTRIKWHVTLKLIYYTVILQLHKIPYLMPDEWYRNRDPLVFNSKQLFKFLVFKYQKKSEIIDIQSELNNVIIYHISLIYYLSLLRKKTSR